MLDKEKYGDCIPEVDAERYIGAKVLTANMLCVEVNLKNIEDIIPIFSEDQQNILADGTKLTSEDDLGEFTDSTGQCYCPVSLRIITKIHKIRVFSKNSPFKEGSDWIIDDYDYEYKGIVGYLKI